MLDELTPIDWAVATLLGAPEISALIGDRIDDDDNVPEQQEDEAPADYFPRLVYIADMNSQPYASELDLGYGELTIKVIMREDALPPGENLKAFTRRIAQLVENALRGAPDPERLGDERGRVHGCETIDFYSAPLYGARGQRICERGRIFRLIWS